MSRYWALIILSVVYRLGGVLIFVLTLLAMFSLTAWADNSHQPIVFPTLAPFPTFPPFPDFSFSSPPPLPFPTNPDQLANQLRALGAFSALLIFIGGSLLSLCLYAAGQFLDMMIDIEYNMSVAANGLQARLRRR